MKIAISPVCVEAIVDFEHAIAQVPDANLHDVRAIAIRVNLLVWDQLTSWDDVQDAINTQIDLIKNRAPNTEIFIFLDGHSLANQREPGRNIDIRPRRLLSNNSAFPIFEVLPDDLTAILCDNDLTQILISKKSRCIVCSAEEYHFVLPSEAHATQFVRLAEAFTDLETIDRMAYWVAHSILQAEAIFSGGNKCLIVDHPSMLILGARVCGLLPEKFDIRALKAYPSDSETLRETTEFLDAATEGCEKLVLLIGIASTGRLAKILEKITERKKESSAKTIVLFGMKPIEDARVLSNPDLPDYRHYENQEACELCLEQSNPVPINKGSYLVGYEPAKPISLPIQLFTDQKDFIQKYGAIDGVLRVHYDDPNESTPRHHAFYIDIGTLLRVSDFKDEITNFVEKLTPAHDLVISPNHHTAKSIGSLISARIGKPFFPFKPPLGKADKDLLKHIKSAKTVLVVDDTFISGKTLDEINRTLRENRKLCSRLTHVHFFPLVAIPSTQKAFERRRNGLTAHHNGQKNEFHCLHTLYLPDWHESKNCPWCIELEIIKKISQAGLAFESPFEDRQLLLSSSHSRGLSTNCFSAVNDSQLPPLGAGSNVLDAGANGVQVLFAFASAIQKLRMKEKQPLNPMGFPAPTFIAEEVFSNYFSERLIWLMIIKSVKINELHTKAKKFLREASHKVVLGEEADFLHYELAIAWLSGKLGNLTDDVEMKKFFAEIGMDWDSIERAGFFFPY